MVFGIYGVVKGLTRGRQKSSTKIQKLFGVFQKELRSIKELNNKVIDINE
jgi:hypothetical protein